ncbi:MAG: aspartyl/asparaginyl beta-hydroxylase domain-containing protein [Betaproteobacteria bacterium]|nr:aspartyl/asparaginyl beta-hydroxylase domain-containing protein [Betaproteobacteria bacterium]
MRGEWLRVVNRYLDRHTGGAARPVSFDVDATCPALSELQRRYVDVRTELLGVLDRRDQIPKYHEIDSNQAYISSSVDTQSAWRTFVLYSIGTPNALNAARCPTTAAMLARVPHLVNAFFSILEPGKSIPAHCGPYRGVLRYHLALIVPTRNRPSIRVRDHVHTWTEGEGFLFDDSWEHEVYNKADELRAVLAVDVLRPLPLLPHLVNRMVIWRTSQSEHARDVERKVDRAARDMH